jgi:transporter family protein
MNWLVYALLSALFAGLIAVFAKIGMREIDSTLATAARSVIMAVALVALVAARGDLGSLRDIGARAWVFIALAGACGAASWLCYFRALQIGDAVRVAPIDRLSILVTTVLAVAFLGEKVSVTTGGGILLILTGAILIARG